jgi:hypothetical protein
MVAPGPRSRREPRRGWAWRRPRFIAYAARRPVTRNAGRRVRGVLGDADYDGSGDKNCRTPHATA